MSLSGPFNDFADLVRRAGHHRISHMSYEGQSVWVKKSIAGPGTFLPLTQKAFRAAGAPPIFAPTHRLDQHQGLLVEAQRLRAFGAKGHPVPRILMQLPGAIIITDTGPSLWDIARSRDSLKILLAGASALALLHNAGDYHGNPTFKNLTSRDGKVHFIDLEEDGSKIPLTAMQMRDVWQLVFASWPFADRGPDVARQIAEAYQSHAHQKVMDGIKGHFDDMSGFRSLVLHIAFERRPLQTPSRHVWTAKGIAAVLK